MGNYHSGTERITSSGLKILMHKSPHHYYERYANAIEEKPTRAKVLGSVTHALILEGEKVARDRYGIAPSNPGTKGYATWLEAEDDLLGGLKEEDWDIVQRMRDSLYSVAGFRDMLATKGKAEQEVQWIDAITGAPCKCKPDWFADDSSLMIDLKTARDASFWGFDKAVRVFDYDLSAAFYMQGAEATRNQAPVWQWVVVENEAPYAATIYDISRPTLEKGEAKVFEGLDLYMKCKAEGVWPSYPQQAI